MVNGHINVTDGKNSASLFSGDGRLINGVRNNNGLQFRAYAGHYDGGGYATLEVCPREYRIFMNCVGSGAENECSFTIDNVPNGYYIWIEALSAKDYGVRFSLSGPASCDRIDGKGTDEMGKHLFCYKTNAAGSYVIKPISDSGNGACYLYYVAVMDHPCPLINFTVTEGMYIDMQADYIGPFKSNFDGVTFDGVKNESISQYLEFSSDDETVLVVDKKSGEITGVGKGTATVTATLPQGTPYYYNNKWNYLVHPITASYKVDVRDSRVISKSVAESENKNLWEEFSVGNDVKIYMGGWKYQNNSALKDVYTGKKLQEGYTGSGENKKTDFWDKAKKYSVGYELPVDYQAEPIDGYIYYNLGKENGKNEFLYGDAANADNNVGLLLAGDYDLEFKERNPDVVVDDIKSTSQKENQEGKVKGRGNPFTVPCFGSFIKIEPERNGQMTLYIMQNGNLEFDSDHNNHLIGRLGWRPIYIVDEAGNRLLSKDVKAVTKQRTMISYNDETSDVYEPDGVTLMMKDGTPSVYTEVVKEYKDDTTQEWIYKRHKDLFDTYWGRRGSSEIVLDPDITGDGWVVMTKAYVKYQFDVKAGKSYYVFANKSAIGFCGASFLPSDSPSGDYTISDDGTMSSALENRLNSFGENGSLTVNSITFKNTKGEFHQGWNSICLPFSITESKMRKIFGTSKTDRVQTGTFMGFPVYDYVTTYFEDYEVLLFNGCTEETDKDGNKTDKVHFFHHVYQDIIAGYPYMIWIPENADIIGKKEFKVEKVTIEKESLNNRPTISTSKQYMPVGSGLEGHSTIDDFTFTGVYNPTDIPKDSYCVVETGIRIYNAVTLPGYRAYLHPSYKNKGTSNYEVKRISATNLNELTYIWDEANPIKSIWADEMLGNGFSAPSDVYSVSGVLVRKNSTSLEGLPKGIYIVNGKKYLVK